MIETISNIYIYNIYMYSNSFINLKSKSCIYIYKQYLLKYVRNLSTKVKYQK